MVAVETEAGATNGGGLGRPEIANGDFKSLIHTVRGRQVMLDSDLAKLYEVETKSLNRAAVRNGARFPDDFRFQLTRDEFEALRCQIGTSNAEGSRGGRRYMPYAYTEQGVAMLSGVLRSDVAVGVSINIMRAFVQMRRFLADNAGLLQRMDVMEARQLEYQQHTDERFRQVFGCLEAHSEEKAAQAIFFDGQIYDAFELLTQLVKKAKRSIVLIDGYVDLDTLNILAKKCKDVDVALYTTRRGNRLTDADVEKFNAQYRTLSVKSTDVFHDRFLIVDGEEGYHVGASLKDAGRKCFGISKIEDGRLVRSILERVGERLPADDGAS